MPAHVASDTARDGTSARERPSKTYHVQVCTVEAKSEADRAVSDVMSWFNGLDRDERPLPLSRVSSVPVDVRWKAPFYRVRVGPFTSKEAAESVLQSVQRRFPDAFIAKEVIEEDAESRRTFWYESPAGSLDDWDRDRDWNRDQNWSRGQDWDRQRDWDREEWNRRDEGEKTREQLERERLERERERRDREWERRRERWERQREQREDWKRDEARRGRSGNAAETRDANGEDAKKKGDGRNDDTRDGEERDDGGW